MKKPTPTLVTYLKDFFYLKKWKLVIMLVFVAVLGMSIRSSSASLLDILGLITFVYVYLSLFFFAVKSKKHFLIGSIIFIILWTVLHFRNKYEFEYKSAVKQDCFTQARLAEMNGVKTFNVRACMSERGVSTRID